MVPEPTADLGNSTRLDAEPLRPVKAVRPAEILPAAIVRCFFVVQEFFSLRSKNS